jgi:hypothetical protein
MGFLSTWQTKENEHRFLWGTAGMLDSQESPLELLALSLSQSLVTTSLVNFQQGTAPGVQGGASRE